MKALDGSKLTDATAERVRRSQHEAIQELQGKPAATAEIKNDVVLPDSAIVLVAHGLGRRPRIVLVSPPRGPIAIGIIEERVVENPDRTRYVALKASGMGTTVTVDVEVK